MATTPKAPQDHKAKDEKPKVEEVEIDVPDGNDGDGNPKVRKAPARRVTVRDIEVAVLDEALNDFEVLDDLRAAQDQNDPSRGPALLRRIAGDAQYKTILESLRGPHGRVTVEDGMSFVWDLIKALNPNS